MVFQSYAIWPHLTVAQNVAFPLTVKGVRKTGPAVDWALNVVGMTHLAARRPSELSGGQQQRVALARAIAARPQLLLFDEPLSNLDARLRDRTRLEISRIQRELKVPALYVTHDQTEALSMSDRVIVMEAGTIVQEGRPDALYHHPVNRFVADFIGNANFLDVQRVGQEWQMPDGTPIQVDPASDGCGDAAAGGVAAARGDPDGGAAGRGGGGVQPAYRAGFGQHVSGAAHRIHRRGRACADPGVFAPGDAAGGGGDAGVCGTGLPAGGHERARGGLGHAG